MVYYKELLRIIGLVEHRLSKRVALFIIDPLDPILRVLEVHED
jgi:hypothetical protein